MDNKDGKRHMISLTIVRNNFQIAIFALFVAACSDSSTTSVTPRTFNVVFISVDSLRADHLSCYGYDKKTSPAIDRLAEEGILFEHVIAESSWTLPAHATLFTGMPSSIHEAVEGPSPLEP